MINTPRPKLVEELAPCQKDNQTHYRLAMKVTDHFVSIDFCRLLKATEGARLPQPYKLTRGHERIIFGKASFPCFVVCNHCKYCKSMCRNGLLFRSKCDECVKFILNFLVQQLFF